MIEKDVAGMVAKWPSSVVARSEVGRFTGGAVSPRRLANLNTLGVGPRKIVAGGKIVYNCRELAEWCLNREAPERKARARKAGDR